MLALHTLGQQPDAAARASRFLLSPDSIRAYAHGAPYEQGQAAYAEPLAKLQIVARFPESGADAEAVGQLRTDLAALRTASGEFTDTGEFADTTGTLRRHAWATLATTAGADPAEAPVGALIAHQCADGLFPAVLTGKPCATGDLTATAAAVEALNAVPRDGRAPGNVAPAGWTPEHRQALESAAAALTTRTGPDGTIAAADGQPDPVLTAAVAERVQLRRARREQGRAGPRRARAGRRRVPEEPGRAERPGREHRRGDRDRRADLARRGRLAAHDGGPVATRPAARRR